MKSKELKRLGLKMGEDGNVRTMAAGGVNKTGSPFKSVLSAGEYLNGNKISQQSMNKLFDYHIEPLLSEYLRSEYNEEDIEKHVKNLKNHFKLESK